MKAINLKTEYQQNPIDIGTPRPRFSWETDGAMQSAYRIETYLGDALVWDSGKTVCDAACQIPYDGASLAPCAGYSWRVKLWDAKDTEGEWSEAYFETTFFDGFDAKWISHPLQKSPEGGNVSLPSPYFRQNFTVDKGLVSAKLHITSLGLYHAFINGTDIAEGLYAPDWTDYNCRLHYQTYGVTELLREGKNTAAAVLGDGWYTGFVAHCGRKNYGDYPLALYALLLLTYEDGHTEQIITDGQWRVSFGPIVSGDLLMGEYYDATREISGWNTAGYDDSGWHLAAVVPENRQLIAQPCPPVRKHGELRPLEFWQTDIGTYVFNLGQNITGRVRLCVHANAGDCIRLRHGEMVYPLVYKNRRLYTGNLRGALATDTYICKGGEEEVYEPTFTFHGFQYIEVSGLREIPTLDTVTGISIGTDLKRTGSFACSDPLINQLYSNIFWGQKDNFFSVPTDCPQRDERLGWLGDAQVFASTACYNMEADTFYEKYLSDLMDAQMPDGGVPMYAPTMNTNLVNVQGWADAMIIIPWTLYQFYANTQILENSFSAMQRLIDYLVRRYPEYLCDNEGFGDWLSVNAETPKSIVNTAYFAYSALIFSRICGVLNRTEEHKAAFRVFEQVKARFNAEFVSSDLTIKSDTQCSYVLALAFELLNESDRSTAAAHLVRRVRADGNKLTVGFLSVPYLLPVLCDYGYSNAAYDILEAREYPSWLYSIQNGATTIWERWNSYPIENGVFTLSVVIPQNTQADIVLPGGKTHTVGAGAYEYQISL